MNTNKNDPTVQTKPSTMDQLKDKASNLIHKVADKMHGQDDTTTHTTLNTAPESLPHQNVADPRRQKGEGAAGPYQREPQSQLQPQHQVQLQQQQRQQQQHPGIPPPTGPVTDTQATSGLHHPASEGVAATPGNARVPTYVHNIPPTASHTAYLPEQTVHDPARDPTSHQDHHHHHHHKVNEAKGISGLPVNTNNSTVPVTEQHLHQSTPVHTINAATSVPPPVPPKDQVSTVPAMGASGTTTAAGTHIPGEYNRGASAITDAASRPKDPVNTVPAMGASSTTTAARTHIPSEYNPGASSITDAASRPKEPVNTVPAMGAPGTTTAAGTHIPGEYNRGASSITDATSRPKEPVNTVPAMGAPGTTTAAGTHIPGEYNPGAATITDATGRPKPADKQMPAL
ncbi:hypothetical protein B0O80DRAFT_483693 [Mortierella sp. GBAus27b]|nr:hypothetical protein BGX31_008408 [Mortierella sp. GBA43]KAI8361462.1 hypothetical protein B0O80DRAFT_483693 [Mortierella sp. GBAus27b]